MNYSRKYAINQEIGVVYNHLITRLPSLALGFNSKEDFEVRIPYPSYSVLDRFKWVEYNSGWVNMLIFDIDRSMSLQDGINLCLDIEFEPTWICKTDRGVHIAYTLTDRVDYSWKKAIKLARHIKEKITSLLKADIQGSHKLKGVWRNPLLHEHYFSGLTYSLNDFKYLLDNNLSPQRKFKKHIVKSKIDRGALNYDLGTRNDYIWRMAMLQSKEKNLSFDDTYDLVNDLNSFESSSNGIESLPKEEVMKIAKSVFKYNEKDMNYIGGVDSKKNIRGAMGFEPIAKDGYVSPKAHKQEVSRRQSESAIRTKGLDMTRSERAKANAVKKEKETREMIENTITGVFADQYFKKKNGKWNGVAIAEHLKIDPRTVRKHLKEIEK